jgi:hypothetical protein
MTSPANTVKRLYETPLPFTRIGPLYNATTEKG